VLGLEQRLPGFGEALSRDPRAAAARATREQVPLLYWTAAALALAISLQKGEPELIARLPEVEALMKRALALDEAHGKGAIHEFFISYLGGDDEATAREHYRRALVLSSGHAASPHLALAESVCVKKQDRAEFEALLNKVLAIDVDKEPESRLANVIAQRKARRLLEQIDDLFLE